MQKAGLITDNVNEVFSALQRTADQRGSNLAGNTIVDVEASPELKKALTKQAQLVQGASGASVSRMAPSIWEPTMQLSTFMLPKGLIDKNRWRRWYYQHDPVVGTAIDLHTRFPISTFRLRCEDDLDGEIAAEYEEMAEEVNLFDLLLRISQEYWVCGEAIPFGDWNDEELLWNGFVLMNPDCVDIQCNPFSPKRYSVTLARWSDAVRTIVSKGPNDPRTGQVYKELQKHSPDLLTCIRDNNPYKLSELAVSHIARKVSEFDIRGTSIIDRIFRILLYQDKLVGAQMAGAERYATPVEIWKTGESDNPADAQELQELEAVLRSTWNSPQKAIIWNHTLTGEMVSGSGSLLPLAPEFDYCFKEKMVGLFVNESLLHGEGPTYANASVAMDFQVSWYMTFRMELEKWMKHHFFEPIARSRGYYKASQREIAGHYRDRTTKRKLMLPEIVWDKANLRDDWEKTNTYINLASQRRLTWRIVYEQLNVDFDTTIEQIKDEAKLFAEIDAIQAPQPEGGEMGLPGGGPLGGGGGMPDIGMGGGEEMGPPTGEGLPPGDQMALPFSPASGEASVGGLTAPAESFE